MPSAFSTSAILSTDGYRIWAHSYDSEPNPMLSLEGRFLEALLPDAKELDVVDLGCGTGRWLAALQGRAVRSLLGVDSSPEMLEVAKSKLGSAAKLINADCEAMSLPDSSADLILCSFLLSYVENASRFLRRIRAMLRDGGSAFVTDLHPETASRLNWRRGVRVADEFTEIHTFQRSLNTIVQLCEGADLEVEVCIQPRFGDPERSIFRTAGKQEYFQQVKEYPAIYILRLRAREIQQNSSHDDATSDGVVTLCGVRLALSPQSSAYGDVQCMDSRIASLCDESGVRPARPSSPSAIDLSGFLVLPGLVNSHDHLEFALFPRLGRGAYQNFLEWADDIHCPGHSPIREHRRVPREVRLWWGGIRNLLSGVTTVCHHNPYEAAVFENDFVVRVIREYGWAHSLPMDGEFAAKKRQTPIGQPFLIHLGEGTDECSTGEIFELQQSGALDDHTILIHGLALNKKGRALVRSSGAGLIWCPSSNIFLFGKTLSYDEIQSLPLVALGSDSPLTAEGDLLDELRFARRCCAARAEELYTCVTQKAAQLLRLRNGEGTLGIGAWADLVAVRDTGASPADTLAALSYEHVELVLLRGRVQLASEETMKRLPSSATSGLQPIRVESSLRWIRAPLERLFKETEPHLGGEIQLGGKRVSLGL
jgi:cytosine/adenosine deaminase-related metal-dependent hydrolase/ubiquinone/menaquinone biosynthesis C-methylase UbiE